MMKKQRFIFGVLAFVLICSLCGGATTARASDVLRSSPTLTRYGVVATKGTTSGKVVFTYDILANSVAESLGISSIVIYKSSGDYVTTIYPTTLNGLNTSNAMWHRSSYTYSGTSGVSYYAMVTVFATINGVTDSRTVNTITVAAP